MGKRLPASEHIQSEIQRLCKKSLPASPLIKFLLDKLIRNRFKIPRDRKAMDCGFHGETELKGIKRISFNNITSGAEAMGRVGRETLIEPAY